MADGDTGKIAPARILARDLWEDERKHALEYLSHETKGIAYLLTAHGAGLAGALSLLKDYETVPQLKGVGLSSVPLESASSSPSVRTPRSRLFGHGY
jgi:hypothetical protein